MAEQQNQQKEFFTEIKNEFKEIGSKVNRVFDELVRGRDGKSFSPAADAYETKEELVYELDLPGCLKSDFQVQVRDNALVVKGQRTKLADPEANYMQRERGFGEFERSFVIPGNVDQSRIKAKFENGVLKLTLPKEAVEVEATHVNVD